MNSDIEIKVEKENSIVYIEINDIITVQIDQNLITYDYVKDKDKDIPIILKSITNHPTLSKISIRNNTKHPLTIQLHDFKYKRIEFNGIFEYIQLIRSTTLLLYVIENVKVLCFINSKVTKRCYVDTLKIMLFGSHIHLLYSYLGYTKIMVRNSFVKFTNIYEQKVVKMNLVKMYGFLIPLEDIFEGEMPDKLLSFLIESSI